MAKIQFPANHPTSLQTKYQLLVFVCFFKNLSGSLSLANFRRQVGLSQDQASALRGYSRPTIGHVENGRIELSTDQVKHIINFYGFSFSEFEKSLEEEELRDEKLNLLKGILESF